MYCLRFQGRLADRPAFFGRERLVTVGRAAGCQLHLPVNGIRDRHALIEQRADGYYLRELDGGGSVRVNQVLVAQQRLEPGDEIEIGPVQFQFEVIHETGPRRRAFDIWQLTAVAVVAGLLVGEVALLAWVLPQPRPARLPREKAYANRAPADAAPSAGLPLAVPGPVVASPAPAPAAPSVPATLNRKIRLEQVAPLVEGGRWTLSIRARAQVGDRELDTRATAIGVQFFHDSGRAGPAPVSAPLWLAIPSWENFTSRSFAARLDAAPGPTPAWVVATFYRGELQDVSASSPALRGLAAGLMPTGLPGGVAPATHGAVDGRN